jgi:hypothetical protein
MALGISTQPEFEERGELGGYCRIRPPPAEHPIFLAIGSEKDVSPACCHLFKSRWEKFDAEISREVEEMISDWCRMEELSRGGAPF